MAIKAIKGLLGEEQAFCTCDACGSEITIKARHGDGRARKGSPLPNVMTIHSEAAVIEALGRYGWAFVKGKLRCKSCEEKRREKSRHDTERAIEMATVTTKQTQAAMSPREPTGPQKRLIILALEDAYDDAAKRYKGAGTDAAVAADLGGGVMPGWVTAIREEMFGPAGNEEIEAIRREIVAMRDAAEKAAAEIIALASKQADALQKRIEAVERASDRRVKS